MENNSNTLPQQNIMETLRPFLLSHHTSAGSIFLLSLFDGHSQVLMLPGYVNFTSLFTEKLTTADKAFDVFCKYNPKFFDTSEMTGKTLNHSGFFYLGENQDEGFVTPREIFIKHYKNYLQNLTISTRKVIDAIYYAFAKAHRMDLSKKKVIMLHPYSHFLERDPYSGLRLNMTLQFHQIYPGSKVLVPFRHPINAYVSTKKNIMLKAKKRDQLYIINQIGYLHNLCRHVLPLANKNIEMKLWKLEDLHEFPVEVLGQICSFMGIEYQSCLEESTVNGKKYWGHNQDPKIRMNGFSPEYHRQDLSSELSRGEKIILLALNKRINLTLNYKLPELKIWECALSFFYFFSLRPVDVIWLKRYPSKWFKFIFRILIERTLFHILFFKNIFNSKAYEKIRFYYL